LAISYTWPLGRAWDRARGMLFTRFDLEKWLVLGFAAFVAGLVDTGFGRGAQLRGSGPWRFENWADATFLGAAHSGSDFTWPFILGPLALVAFAVLIALLWVSSRSKFVFLDGVLRDRSAWVEPWRRFKLLGDSLFFWRMGYWLVGLLGMGLSIAPWFGFLGWAAGGREPGGLWILPALFLGLFATLFGIALAVVGLFLESFIVPIMYRHNLTTTAAWRHFLPLLRRNPFEFFLYVLFVILLWVVAVVSLMIVVTMTCCIALPLVAFPYIGSVVLLPLSATFRLFSVEFLAQFGPEYFNVPPVNAPTAPPAPSPAESND